MILNLCNFSQCCADVSCRLWCRRFKNMVNMVETRRGPAVQKGLVMLRSGLSLLKWTDEGFGLSLIVDLFSLKDSMSSV